MKKTTQEAINDGIVGMYWDIFKSYRQMIVSIILITVVIILLLIKSNWFFLPIVVLVILSIYRDADIKRNLYEREAQLPQQKPEPDEYDNFHLDQDI